MKSKTFFFTILISIITCNFLYSQGIPGTINFQGVLKDASGNVVANGDYNLTFRIYDTESGGTALWTETKLITITDGIFSTQLGSVNPINLPFDAAYWVSVAVGSDPEMAPRTPFNSVPYSRISLTVPNYSLTASKIMNGEVVKSLNGLKDSINLVAGSNVTITPSGNNLTISAASGGGGTVTQVNTGAGLTGGPITTTGIISVANDGITTAMLQNNSVTSDKISDGTISTNDLANNSITSTKIADGTIATSDLSDNSVTSAKIVDGTISTSDLANNSVTTDKIVDGTITATDIGNTQVVKSINSLKDNVNLVAGSNITITPSGQNLTISSTSGGVGGSGTVNYLPLFTGTATIGNSILYQSGSQVGVNTTSPDYALTINANPTAGLGLKISRNGGLGMAFIEEGQPVNSKGWKFDVYQQKFRLNTTQDNGYTEIKNLITFDRNGNVGIGVSSPAATMDILGGKWDLVNTEGDFKIGNESVRLKIGVPTAGAGVGNNTIVSQGGNSRLILGAGSTWDDFNTLIIKNRNVGIGSFDPAYPLHISTNRKYAGYFTSDSMSSFTNVVHAEFTGTGSIDGIAVYGKSVPIDYFGIGGYFEGGYRGVIGSVFPTGNQTYYGLYGYVFGGGGNNYAIYGFASGTGTKYGIRSSAEGTGTNYGIYSSALGGTTNLAGYFYGNVNVTGTLSKGGGSFKIDHPLDPQNKYLYHSFVESPDMMNIYNGNVVTDASGYATVTLPEWFEALNEDFRYQLTVIGDFAQAIISQEIQNNRFIIRTDKPNVKVSWQVTGIRHDAFAKKYRIPVEEYKNGDDVGKYLHPEAYGLPETMGIDYKHLRTDKDKK